ncbi:DUF1740-domain-containing protein [Backusella circina FSU 941]|nr:DUF1740-domain-containing protein [Backusella circina FSU 941]
MDPKKILAPPSFSTAPDPQALTSAPPTFSSAPDFSKTKQSRRQERSRSRSPKDKDRSRRPDRRDERSRQGDRSRGEKRRDSSRERSSRRRHSRERSSRRRSTSPDRKRHRDERRKQEKEPLHSGQLETGIMFVIDRYGDRDQLRYGIDQSKVPFFHRLHRSSNYDKQKTLRDSSKTWEFADTKLKRLRIYPSSTPSDDPFANEVGHVRFEDFESKNVEIESDYVASGVDYRSVEGNKVKRMEEDPDLVESEVEEEGESFQDYIRNRTIQFNRDLDKHPYDTQLWLQFIEFQDEAANSLDTGTTAAEKTKSSKGSIADVKLSIFEKAMDLNPDDEELMLGYLACGAEIWETKTLLQEWDKVLRRHPDSIRLWSEYINLRQTNFASFTFGHCLEVFSTALKTLNKHLYPLQAKKAESNYEERENIESLMVYMVLRTCLFVKQSGYYERAVAILQGSIEFNLFQPQLFSMSLNKQTEKMASFDDFWDSEVARFGEEGALGWSEFYRAKHNGEAPEDNIVTSKDEKNDNDEYEMEFDSIVEWLSAERERDEKDRMPMRMSQADDDDDMDDDPFKITLSDDIRPFLFDITTSGAKESLIFSLFVLFGLPFTPPEVGTNTHFFTDTFTHNDMFLNQFWPRDDSPHSLVWYVAGVPMEPEHVTNDTDMYHFPISYPVGLSELFSRKDHHWFQCSSSSHVPNVVDQVFIRNAFEQLLSINRQDYLCIYYMAFESGLGYKNGRQLAKRLLSQQKENLILWNAYAQMEKSQGRMDEARKVYLTLLSRYQTFSESSQKSAPLIYRMFAQLELDQGQPDEALKILVSMSDSKPYDKNAPSPTVPTILRTREYFNQKKGQLSSLSESSLERQAAHDIILCSASFEYLSCGIEEASRVYEHALKYLKERHADRSYASETLWIEYARLHYHHAIKQTTSFGYQPQVVRSILLQALELYPNNTIFIALHAWNESRTKIYSRVKTFFDNSLKKDPNVILWLSAIYNELHRSKPYQVNQTRDFFERSIACTKTRCSILLWKLYIEFEMKQKSYSKAQSLFYRSLRECPWSKELYLIGIQKFQLSKKEINELISLIMEKEIRLRVSPDDQLKN